MGIYAKFGDIPGESAESDHEAWVEIDRFSWGAQRLAGDGSGTIRRRSRADVHDMELAFSYEKAAPRLLDALLRGTVLDRVDVHFTAIGEGQGIVYLEYELEKVGVTGYTVSSPDDDGAERPRVDVAIDFQRVVVTYHQIGADGSDAGTTSTTWDLSGAIQ